ncbi:MarR family winged helix-turn-helix transcriptional regulator [Legionella micdadei]|uniref:DNA-binding transcriptional regulator, MarR family n=1 Tax=Legionella micdadei TaxID=451 RepID=A0A098GG96_LEGMI|nr:MarR family transcriptional regulator [Legionella micdadei]ARG97083.1 transcriptional regulator [Legionella micdadei]ARH00658.1 transcriptional regulator [Legionella micdadei]KTD26812.1 DNA-binding transcriptional repressor MarR [Legionella micdadei]NSL18311.1 MarR family transcriptional regulator [Legionella micdadei]CEG61488.1 Regulatory protein, MarR family [Legionella micdadei]
MSTNDDKNILLTNLKGLLQEKLWKLEERLANEREKSSYQHLTGAQSRILATLRGENLTISEVGRRLGISRQAVHKIVSQLVNEGILSLEPMPENNRDKIIVFTEKGVVLKETAKKALKKLDDEVKEKLGDKDFELLKEILSKPWW